MSDLRIRSTVWIVFCLGSTFLFAQLPAGSKGNPQHNAGGGAFGALSNVMDANAFASVGDFCLQVGAAITALGANGGTVDARGVTSASCGSLNTLMIPTNITVLFPTGTVTFNGNPGIQITGPGVTLRGSGLNYNGTAQTVLKSGASGPLIANLDNTFHGSASADSLLITDLDLFGNNIGSFGVFITDSYSVTLSNVHTHEFTAAGILELGGTNVLHSVTSDTNGLDGLVWGPDGHVDGLSSAGANGANGWHVYSGGTVFDGIVTYHNNMNGFYADGQTINGWTSGTTYTQPTIIKVGTSFYYTQELGTSLTGTPPTFDTTIGKVIMDNTVLWICIGQMKGYDPYGTAAPGAEFNATWNILIGNNHGDNGLANTSHNLDFDEIRIEGNETVPAYQNQIIGAQVTQAELSSEPTHGIHLKHAFYTSLDSMVWWGGSMYNIADKGGLEIEDSLYLTVGNVHCYASFESCLHVDYSGYMIVDSVVSYEQAGASTPTGHNYAIVADSHSNQITINSVLISDDRALSGGTNYAGGISSGTPWMVARNITELGLVSTGMDTQNFVRESLSDSGNNDGFTYNTPLGYVWNLNGTTFARLTALGLYVTSGTFNIAGLSDGCLKIASGVVGSQTCGSGGMVYPSGTGVPQVLSGSSWGTTLGVSGSGAKVSTTNGLGTQANAVMTTDGSGNSQAISGYQVNSSGAVAKDSGQTTTGYGHGVEIASGIQTGLALAGTPGNLGSAMTLTSSAPKVGWYLVTFDVTVTTAGVSCTNGTAQMQLTYTNGLNNVTQTAVTVPVILFANTLSTTVMAIYSASLTSGEWVPAHSMFIYAKAGSAVTLQVYQNNATMGCSTPPVIAVANRLDVY